MISLLLITIYLGVPLFLLLYALFGYVKIKSYGKGFNDYKQMLEDMNMEPVHKKKTK